jgi:hypothetical protein
MCLSVKLIALMIVTFMFVHIAASGKVAFLKLNEIPLHTYSYVYIPFHISVSLASCLSICTQ